MNEKLRLHYTSMPACSACQHFIQHKTCDIDEIVALQHAWQNIFWSVTCWILQAHLCCVMLVVLILVAVDLSPALFCIADFEFCLFYPTAQHWVLCKAAVSTIFISNDNWYGSRRHMCAKRVLAISLQIWQQLKCLMCQSWFDAFNILTVLPHAMPQHDLLACLLLQPEM